MIRRHPHVFGNVHVDGEEDVIRNWQEIKKREKKRQALLGIGRYNQRIASNSISRRSTKKRRRR